VGSIDCEACKGAAVESVRRSVRRSNEECEESTATTEKGSIDP